MFSICNPCSDNSSNVQSDADTVKVVVGRLTPVSDKENDVPGLEFGWKCVEPMKEEETEEAQLLRSRDEEQQRADEISRLRRQREERQRRLAEEQQRLQELEHQESSWAHRQEHRKRLLEEENQGRGPEKAAKAKEQREQEEQRLAEEAQKQDKLNRFLTTNGFKAVNTKKKTGLMLSSGATYPLHAAVKARNAEAVELLLWGGADRTLTDSAKLTPLALAKRLNKRESHTRIVDLLSA